MTNRRIFRKQPILPGWLNQLKTAPASVTTIRTMPPWHEALWAHLPSGPDAHLILHGTLYYNKGRVNKLSTSDRGLVCRLDQPVTSSTGLHGLHLLLECQQPPLKAQTLLLTPGTFARLGESGSYPEIQIHPLDAPFFVLLNTALRLEGSIQKVAYQQTDPADLLQQLALKVVIWKEPVFGEEEPPSVNTSHPSR